MVDVRSLKKLEFHDHLDGSMRPQTVWELAQKAAVPLAALTDCEKPSPNSLAAWFAEAAHSRSLSDFLRRFSVTVAVLQTESALFRAAFEAAEDWHAAGVVYGELRFAPENHTNGGLLPEAAVEAVSSGLKAAEKKFGIRTGLILCAMRQNQNSKAVAELCLKRRDLVCGFDLAGPERGFPATLHAEAFAMLAASGFEGVTCHAGEEDEAAAVEAALKVGARRIGHGISARRLCEKLSQVLVECCLTSNAATGNLVDLHRHPVQDFYRQSVPFLLCCDDRLMCATDLNLEYEKAARFFDWKSSDFNEMNRRAVDFAFGLSAEEKKSLKKIFECDSAVTAVFSEQS